MRTIRVGDGVQAFLDTRMKGKVVEIIRRDGPYMVGGTAQAELFCVVEQQDGQRLTIKMSELHHTYDS